METKLKLAFQSPRSLLVLKAVIFGSFLTLVKIGGFSFLAVLLFLLTAMFLYAKPLFRTIEHIWPFSILLIVSLITMQASTNISYSFVAAVYFSFLFYLILGVKDLIFIRRSGWYRVMNLGLAYSILILFFYYNQDLFFLKSILVFLAILLIMRDQLKRRVFSWLSAFLVLESAWAISLLPIGFINSANLAILVYFTLAELMQSYLNSSLNRKKALTVATVAVLLLLAILFSSEWGI